jgi:hypothetical protein
MANRTVRENNTVVKLPGGTSYSRADLVTLAANLADLLTVNTGGTTAERPVTPILYQSFFDTTLGKPVWFDGTNWVDGAGTIS